MTDPTKRMLSAIYNKSHWDFWTSLCWKIGDIGIHEPIVPEVYARQCKRFPRCVVHALGDWCESRASAYYVKWANRPMTEWPRNRKIKKPQHPAGRNHR